MVDYSPMLAMPTCHLMLDRGYVLDVRDPAATSENVVVS